MRKMKDSGIPWLGEIPNSWNVFKVKNIAKRKSDKNRPDKQVLSLYRELGIVIKSERDDNHNVTSENTENYRFVEKNDIVVNKMKAWQGSIAISAHEGIVSPAYYVYKFTNDNVYPWYVHYVLRCKAYLPEYRRLSGGIRLGQWDLSDDNFKNIPLPMPDSYEEQKRIADYLNEKCAKIDAIIEKQQAVIEKLKEYKLSVITEAVTNGLNPNVEMKESGVDWIGTIPHSWNISKLKYLGKFINGFAFPSSDFTASGIRVIKIANIQPMRISWEDESFVDFSKYEKQTEYCVETGDLVFALTRPIINGGIKVAIADVNEKVFLNQRNAMFKGEKILTTKWQYYLMQNTMFVQKFATYIDGTGQQPNISTSEISNIPIPLPSINEQQQITDYLDKKCCSIDKIIEAKEQTLTKLIEYKKSLIYEVVTGKKEV